MYHMIYVTTCTYQDGHNGISQNNQWFFPKKVSFSKLGGKVAHLEIVGLKSTHFVRLESHNILIDD